MRLYFRTFSHTLAQAVGIGAADIIRTERSGLSNRSTGWSSTQAQTACYAQEMVGILISPAVRDRPWV